MSRRLSVILAMGCLVALGLVWKCDAEADVFSRDASNCASATFKVRNNLVYVGGDVFKYTKLKTGQGSKDCLNLCRVVDECWAFNYVKSTKFCYLISNDGAVLKSRRRSQWSSGYRQCVDHSDNNSWNNDAIDAATTAPYNVKVFVDLETQSLIANWDPPSTAGRAAGNHVTYKIKCGPENNDFSCDEKGTWEPDTLFTKTEIQPNAAGYRAFYDLFSMKCYIVYYMSGLKMSCSDAASVQIIPQIATANRDCSRVQLLYDTPALPVVKYTAICTAGSQIRAGESIYLGLAVQGLSLGKEYSCIVNACTKAGLCKTIATARVAPVPDANWESDCTPADIASVVLTQDIVITYNSGNCPTSPIELKAIVDDLCNQVRSTLVTTLGYSPDQISCSGTATCVEARRRSLLAGYDVIVDQTVEVNFATQGDVANGGALTEILSNPSTFQIEGATVDPGPVTETVVPTLTVTTAANNYPFQRVISWTTNDAGISVTGYVVRCEEASSQPQKFRNRNLLASASITYRKVTVGAAATSAIIGNEQASAYNFELKNNVDYICSVQAVNDIGPGVPVYASSFTTPQRDAPGNVVTNLVISDHNTWKVTWNDGTKRFSDEKYFLKCGTDNTCTSSTNQVKTSGSGIGQGVGTGTLTELTPNTAYYCFVIASSWAGDVCSAAVTFRTLACACDTSVPSGGGFGGFTAGISVLGQGGWFVGSGSSQFQNNNTYIIGSAFDEKIVDIGGTKYWRISDAVVKTSYSDMPHSPLMATAAGETGASTSVSGTTITAQSKCFCGSFSMKSATGTPQPGLRLGIAPAARKSDLGSSARLFSWIFTDNGVDGFNVTFENDAKVENTTGPTYASTVTGLTYGWHRVTMMIEFVDGLSNDIVKMYVGDTPIGYNLGSFDIPSVYNTSPRAGNALQFRMWKNLADVPPTGCNPKICDGHPAYLGNGFLFDKVVVNNGINLSN